jgi:hypothetical protein
MVEIFFNFVSELHTILYILPEYQILNMCKEKDMIAGKVHAVIDKFAERGLRSLAVAFQV